MMKMIDGRHCMSSALSGFPESDILSASRAILR
jgi:hypothetical protein